MSIQGNSATIRHQRVAQRSTPRALAVERDEPGWMRLLLMVFLVTLFIPKSVALNIGSIALTPTLASAIVLFPALLSGKRIKFAWPDAIVLLFFCSVAISTFRSVEVFRAVESMGRAVLIAGVPYLMGRYIGSRPGTFNTFMRRLMTVMAVLAVFLVFESLFRINVHSIFWSEMYDPHPEKRLVQP